MTSRYPLRYLNLDSARHRFGERVDRLGDALHRSDPLADDVIHCFATMGHSKGWKLFDRAVLEGIDPAAPFRIHLPCGAGTIEPAQLREAAHDLACDEP